MALMEALDPMDDPRRQSLLALGLGLMNSRGNFGQALGQAGMGAMGTYQQAKQQQQHARMLSIQEQMAQMQLQGAQKAAEQEAQRRALAQQYARTPAQTALAGGGGPTAANAAALPGAAPSFDFDGYAKALAGIDPMQSLQMQGALRKENIKLGPDEKLFDPTGKVLAQNPKGAAPTELARLFQEMQTLPEGHPARAMYVDAIRKATTHQPPVQVNNLGSPVPVQLPDGTTALVQPSNRPGQAPQLMTLPGATAPLRPAKDPAADKPLTETQGKATTFAARMTDAENTIKAMEAKGVSGGDWRTLAAGNRWTNFISSSDGQQYRQAQENWVTANLRQESGAAIGADEMAKDIRKFFPQPGDGKFVVAQKAHAREVAARGMLEQAGPGAKRVDAIVAGDGAAKTVKRTGTYQGRKVIEYTDGTISNAD